MKKRTTDERIRASLRSAAPAAVPPQLLERVTAIPHSHVAAAGRPRPWFWARILVPATVAALLAIGSVASLMPSRPDAPGAAPTSPLKSPGPTATPRPIGGADVVCGDVPHSYKGLFVPFLQCEPAVTKAIAALPADHPLIERLEFGYGEYCRPARPCPTALDLLKGYVLVTYQTGSVVLVAVSDKSEQSGVTVERVEPLP